MGTILYYRNGMRSEPAPDLTHFDSHPPTEREQTKANLQLLAGYLTGDSISMAGVTARPFVGEIKYFNSPVSGREEYEFGMARVGVRENLVRRNLFATVRYVDQLGDGSRTTMERDLPQGDLVLKSIALSMKTWNLQDDSNAPIPVTEKNIQDFLDPGEIDYLYDRAIEMNPSWGNNGGEDSKNA